MYLVIQGVTELMDGLTNSPLFSAFFIVSLSGERLNSKIVANAED